MAFSESDVLTKFKENGGKCEGCKKTLSWDNRGRKGWGKWEAHHKVPLSKGGSDSIRNLKILCWDCHKDTF